MSSRSQTRASSQFAEVVTACSLCVCRAVPTSQTPSSTPWDRTAPASGNTHTHKHPHAETTVDLYKVQYLSYLCKNSESDAAIAQLSPCRPFRILEVARCSQLTDVGFTTLARVSVEFVSWLHAHTHSNQSLRSQIEIFFTLR